MFLSTLRSFLVLGLLLVLVACGGGGGGSSGDDEGSGSTNGGTTPTDNTGGSGNNGGNDGGNGTPDNSAGVGDTTQTPVLQSLITDLGPVGEGRIIDATIQFAGVSAVGDVVQLYLNGDLAGSSMARSDGTWRLDYSMIPLVPGNYSVELTAISPSGATATSARPFLFVYDPNAPAAPVISGVNDDSGVPGDGITSDTTLFINGTAQADMRVELFVNSVLLGATTSDSAGNWSYDHSAVTLADGAYTLSAETVFLTLRSATSLQFNLVVDTQVPAVPVFSGVTPDSGTSATDGLTNSNNLTFTGTAEAGSQVRVVMNSTVIGSATADGAGNWNFNYGAITLPEGSYQVGAFVVDPAGNTSATSSLFVFTIDNTPPAVGTVDAVSPDSGISGDGITTNSQLIFSGTAEPDLPVAVYLDGVLLGTVLADGAGDWTFDHSATTLVDGTYQVTVIVSDAAGNPAAESAPLTVVVDSAPPAAPVVTAFAADTGVAGDGITADTGLVFSGTAEAGAIVQVLVNAAPVGTTTANGAGNWSYDHSAVVLVPGNYAVTAIATDSAGNVSVASAALMIAVDTVAPATPVVNAISTDSGTGGDGITSDNTLSISGASDPNANVDVRVNTVLVGTATASGTGNWTFDYTGTPLADGSYSVTATVSDAAGNTSAPSAAFNVTVDTAIPAVPAISAISTDTGTAGDGMTGDNTLVISGTAEANVSVNLLINAVVVGTVTADGSGNWNFDYTGTVLADNSYAITAAVVDAAGNVSAASATFSVTIDSGVPAAPAAIAITTDTGTAADGITSDNTLVISGTAEANISVNVLLDAVSIGTVTADGAGAWSFDYTGTALADNSYVITAIATDASGNSSATSAAFNVVIDTSTPAVPAVAAITTDSGTASDGITSDNTLVISGTADASITVNVLLNAVSIGTTTASGAGVWSFDYTGTALADNSYVITAIASDGAGNSSAASAAFPLVIDTGTPAAPVVTAFAADTGVTGDGITADTGLVFSGTAEAGAVVQVLVDAVLVGTTTANGAGNWSYDHSAVALVPGYYAVTAIATDSAGNVSATSATLTVAVDSVAPATPVVNAISTDSGTVGDGITTDNTLLISGSSEPNANVDVRVNTVLVGMATASGTGSWTFDYTGTALADGSYSVTATVSDAAGNTSAPSAAFNVTVDTGIPAAPAISAVSTDTGIAGDGITGDNTLVISGTAEANASVNLLINAVVVGTVTADGSGNWNFDYTGTVLADNSYAITATVDDAAGNVSAASATFSVTIDSSVPAAPAAIAITTDTGTAADGITSDNTLVISGTAEANISVNVLLDAVSIGTVTANGAGAWSFDYTGTTLADNSYVITAVASDAAGNSSAASAAFPLVIDTGTPATPVVTGITSDNGTAGDGNTNDNTLVINGTAEAGASVNVLLNAASIGTAIANGGGVWSFDHTGTVLADNSYAITAIATDASGNSSATSAAFNVVIDTSTPAVPAVTAITTDSGTAGDGITSDNTLVISGTADASITVNVLLNAVSIGTTTANGAGVWSFDYTGTALADNSYAITAIASDTSGNSSAASAAFNITVDTGVQAAPVVTGISTDSGTAGDGITSDNRLVIAGTAEAGASVNVLRNI